MSSIGAIVVDGRVYPSVSPSASNNSTYNESQAEQKQSTNSTSAPTDGTVPVVVQRNLILPLMNTIGTIPANAQQNSYQQQMPLQPLPPQQQPQHAQQSQNYMQQYPAPHNMPPRSSPQAQPRVPYVNYNSNRLQSPMMHQQRPLGNCHQQQVTSSTHPHQQVQNLELGQNASLRGLLATNPPLPPPPYPSFRPSANHMSYRTPPGYRYSSNGTPSQRGVVQVPAPHSYQSPNASVIPGTTRLQQCSLTPTTQHMGNYPMQPRWHIPQQANPCLPYTTTRHQQVASNMPAPVNDTYKITLRNQQGNNNQKYSTAASVSPCDNSPQQQNPSNVAGHTVSSSVPKTPSPVTTPGKSDDTEKSLDKFCQKSLNDLMLTIAKLDSNGIVVIPEAQRNQMDSTQVDSSTDEDINSIAENQTGQSDSLLYSSLVLFGFLIFI